MTSDRIISIALLLFVLAAGGCDRAESPSPPSATEAPTTVAPTPIARSGEAWTAGGRWFVRWRTREEGMPTLEPFSLELEVLESPDGPPAPVDVVVRLDAAMPHHGHGMNFVPTVRSLGEGRHLGEGMLLHMGGRWELFVDVSRDGVLERAQWTLEVE